MKANWRGIQLRTLSADGIVSGVFNFKDIESLLSKQELNNKKRIGMLRQYLNERTSKDLITNKELEEFLIKGSNE